MAREEIKSGKRVAVNLIVAVERLSRFSGSKEGRFDLSVARMLRTVCLCVYLSAASDVGGFSHDEFAERFEKYCKVRKVINDQGA